MNKQLLLIAGVAVTSASIYSSASIAATLDGTATANVITPLGITQTAVMSYGDVAGGTGGTTVILASDGTRSGTGVVPGATAVAAGAFDITGENDASYILTLPATATLTRATGTETMSADTFTTSLGVAPFTGTLSATGTDNFTVGATLNIGATQVAGTYNGTYAVTLNYQ